MHIIYIFEFCTLIKMGISDNWWNSSNLRNIFNDEGGHPIIGISYRMILHKLVINKINEIIHLVSYTS